MEYTGKTIELTQILSCLIFDERTQIDFFTSEGKKIVGTGWQAVLLPAMAYNSSEDILLLEEHNLKCLLSRIPKQKGKKKLMLTMISHELRHRVQHNFPEVILWSEKDEPIKARKDVLIKAKKAKRFIRWYYPRKAHSTELDARIISYLVAQEAGESLEHIAEIIRYGPLVFEKFPDWLRSL